jgi:hypothetical protein
LAIIQPLTNQKIIECYGREAPNCFVAISTLRAIVSFCWTFFVGNWYFEAGAAVPFGVFGGLAGAFALLIIPALLWGKRMRMATEKWVL